METKNVNCKKCVYHFITWDNRFPYGCKLFGIKSKQIPSIIVFQSIGKNCENFKEKSK
jgi:Zn-dependent M28 family amino/carboxypeptidase